jgi:hypothetical protein
MRAWGRASDMAISFKYSARRFSSFSRKEEAGFGRVAYQEVSFFRDALCCIIDV